MVYLCMRSWRTWLKWNGLEWPPCSSQTRTGKVKVIRKRWNKKKSSGDTYELVLLVRRVVLGRINMVLMKLDTFPFPPNNGTILLGKGGGGGGGSITVSGHKPRPVDKCFVLILLLVLNSTGVRLVISLVEVIQVKLQLLSNQAF